LAQDVLRHGGMPSLFGGVYALSTLGEFLRAFNHGHVRQFLDVDSLLRRVYGRHRQGAAFGHAKVCGYRSRALGARASCDPSTPVESDYRRRGYVIASIFTGSE
jgi:hypothetical protein